MPDVFPAGACRIHSIQRREVAGGRTSSTMNTIFFPLSFIAAIFAISLGISFFRCLHLVFKRPVYTDIQPDQIPDELLKRLDLAAPLLESWGFVRRRAFSYSGILEFPGEKEAYELEYVHPEKGVFATVTHPLPSTPFFLEFSSCLEHPDGENEIWVTVNGLMYSIPAVPEGCRFFDDYLSAPEAVWLAHCRRVEESGFRVVKDEDVVRKLLRRMGEETTDSFVRQGVLKPAARENRWRLTWWSALRWVLRMSRGSRKARRIPAFSDDKSWRARAESDGFTQNRNISHSMKLSSRSKKFVFVLSAFLFLLLFAFRTNWTFAFALLSIVFLHEGGHWLAMRLTGYRNLSVFFIPGLGGAAVGEKRNATPFERLAVLLAGPLPGLFIVVGTWVAMGEFFPTAFFRIPSGLYFGFLVAFFINYLNLLPISPLDGGRIVELLFFSGRPRRFFCFAVLCCLLLTGLAILWRDPLLIILSGLCAGGLPFQWRLLQGRLALKDFLGTSLSEEAAKEKVFSALQAPRFDRWRSNIRLQVGGLLISECMGRYPTFRESLLGAAIYASCLYFTLSIGLAYGDGLYQLAAALFRR